jgi:hypothetical protein
VNSTGAQVIAARIDNRPRWRRLMPIAAVAAAGIAAVGYVALVDPNEGGHFPACPTQTLFGVDCPGCGGIRSAHALLRGDVAGAADHNLAALVLIPIALLAFLAWARRSWTGITPEQTWESFHRHSRIMLIGVILLVIFGIARNFIPYLGSGAMTDEGDTPPAAAGYVVTLDS